MLTTPPALCQACRFLEGRGGVVLQARNGCGRLGDNEIGAVMGRMLQIFAKEGRCPEYELLDETSGVNLGEGLKRGLDS